MDSLDLETHTIDLKLDEEQELTFEVSIQGETTVTPIYRFVCESNDMSLAFRGVPIGGNQVQVKLPVLKNTVPEGQRSAHLEVIVEDKLFVPMQLVANFKVSTKVVAESVSVVSTTKAPTVVSGATAKIVSAPTISTPAPAVATTITTQTNSTKTTASKAARTLAEVYEAQKVQKASTSTVHAKPKPLSSAEMLQKLWAADKKLTGL